METYYDRTLKGDVFDIVPQERNFNKSTNSTMATSAVEDAFAAQDSFVCPTRARSLLVGDINTSQGIILGPASFYVAVKTNAAMLLQATRQQSHTFLLDFLSLSEKLYFWTAQPLILLSKALFWSVDDTCASAGHVPEAEECDICWDPIRRYHDRGSCTRGHCSFHRGCLLKWKKESRTCPLCRSEL